MLALKAIATYASRVQPSIFEGSGQVELSLNGQPVSTVNFTTQKSGLVTLDTSGINLQVGQRYLLTLAVTNLQVAKTSINVSSTSNFTLFYMLNASYDDTAPPQSNSSLNFSVVQNNISNQVGSLATYSVSLGN